MPAVLEMVELAPDAVLAALLIQVPPVAKSPAKTKPAQPIATRPLSRFCGCRDCHKAQAPPTMQISAAPYIAMEPTKPPVVEPSCAIC